jgi:hypothetical protein
LVELTDEELDRLDPDELQNLLDFVERARVDTEAHATYLRRIESEALKIAERVTARTGRHFRPQSDFSIKTNRSIEHVEAAGRVRKYLFEHSLTQADFAPKAHVDERTIRNLLSTSKASRRVWVEVANAMGITADELLSTVVGK